MKANRMTRMARVLILSALLLFAVVNIGLSAQHEGDRTTAAEVKEEASETYQAMKHYTIQQRDEALASAEKRLEQLDAKIDEMQNDIDERWQNMSKETRENYRQALKMMRQQRNDLAEWYGGMRQSSAEAWEEVKKGFSESFDRLEKSFFKAGKAFSDEKK